MTAWIIIVASLTAVIWLALRLHHLFEGEWLPHDLMREWRLSRIGLDALDSRWSRANSRSDIVISLTTTPSRISMLEPTLKSLLDQSSPPARIILNVPFYSQREGVEYRLPEAFKSLKALDIRRCDDLGPGTKLIPTLAAEHPDTPILVLDDDRIYPAWLIETYEAALARQPAHALTMAGWVVPENLTDTPTTILSNLLMLPPAPIRAPRLRQAREIDVMLGVFSYLVRPRYFDVAEMQNLTDGPEALRYVDDVRTSALCNVAKFVIPARSLSFLPWRNRAQFQATRLGLMNRGTGATADRPNTIAIRHYADRWRVGGPHG